MSATPEGNAPTSRRGGAPVSQAIAAAPPATKQPTTTQPTTKQPTTKQPATKQPASVRLAEDLAAVLAEVHHVRADIHELASGNAIVSVRYGLLAYTDGESFWWTGPELNHAGAPILSSALTLTEAAAQLAEHHALLSAREATDVVRGGLPLLADVILAEHVDPR